MTAALASAAQARAAGAAGPTRVLVVDDSAIVRGLVTKYLEADPEVTVAATAPNGQAALDQLARQAFDLVVLDVEMPVMDGLTALPLMLKVRPGLRVLMASSLTRRNAEISLKALQLGAADYVAKPEGGAINVEAFQRELLAKVKALAPKARRPVSAVAAPRSTGAPALRGRVEAIAIGGSTGAPPVLLQVFKVLKGKAARQPIFVTQHMPPTFTAILAEQLGRAGERPCAEAKDGEPILPGRAYVAPGGWHMTAAVEGTRKIVRLNQDPPENFCRPAVDPMLRSLAQVYGRGLLTVILTGMGADGAQGCQAVAAAGGRFVVQDEASSVVWGMPGAAAKTGLAEQVLSLGDIGPFLGQAAEALV